jgi:phosphoribosylformylglycinamidine synthase
VGDAVLLLTLPAVVATERLLQEFGSSEYAKTILGELWGCPPRLQLIEEAELHKCLAKLADESLLQSARDVSDGGIAVALAEGCFAKGIGVRVSIAEEDSDDSITRTLFGENASEVIVTCAPEHVEKIKGMVNDYGDITVVPLGTTIADQVKISVSGQPVISESIANFFEPWRRGLPDALESTFHGVTSAMDQA